MMIVVITYQDPYMGLEFMLQSSQENEVYRVACLDSYASVFRGSEEIFSSNTFDVRKALNEYLNRRFQNFQVLDYSNGNN